MYDDHWYSPLSGIVSDDKLYVWSEYSSQLHVMPNDSHKSVGLNLDLFLENIIIKQVVCGWSFAYVVKENNDLLEIRCKCSTNKKKYKSRIIMRGQKIRQIASGEGHIVILKDNDDVLVMGKNRFGQLGLRSNNRIEPQLLMHGEKIQQIACGEHHTVILKANGIVLVFGINSNGALGLGDHVIRTVPSMLMIDESIKQIACGMDYTIILKSNNDVLVFGKNNFGQLGLDHDKSIYKPELLMRGKPIRQIICAPLGSHTIIHMSDNSVVGFGLNGQNQLGSTICNSKMINSLFKRHYDKYPPMFLMQDEQISQIALNPTCTMILKITGDVIIFGNLQHQRNKNIHNTPQLLHIKATQLMNQLQHIIWSTKNHKYFSSDFQRSIEAFLFVLHDFRTKTKLFIPKFIRFEIFKYCV